MLINFNPFWGENAEVDKDRGAPKVILLIIGETGATSILNTTHAQTVTLGEPYFVEKGKITGQKELGPNRTQFTFTGNGTMNGNIEVTDTGEFVSILTV